MKKAAVVTLTLISLMTLSAVCIQPIKAQYQGDITIKANGSVNPSTAPIQKMGNIYTLTSDMTGSITVQRNNIILDGNGHTLSNVISLASASNVTIKNLIIKSSSIGIKLWDTSNVIVTNNTIAETSNLPFKPTAGIEISGGSSNIIARNNITKNSVGISLLETSQNLIVENNVTDNSLALLLYDSPNNSIYHNNFINNAKQLHDTGYTRNIVSLNIWDNGYPGGGNYWSDYLTRYPNATEIDSSGIGDTSYFVRPDNYVVPSATMSSQARDYWNTLNALYANNTDRYPLMESFNKFYMLATTPPKISVLSPLNQTYNETSVPLIFTADKPVNWMGYSLDGEPTVTLTANTTISGLTNGVHNVTVYAKDTFENTGASETVSFSVEVPFPATLVIAPVAGVAVIGAVLAIYFKKRKH